MPATPSYTLIQAAEPICLTPDWEAAPWSSLPPARIDRFRPESSGHHPETLVRMLYTTDSLYGIFRVRDCFVRSVQTNFGGPVHTDSCVEFFVQPRADAGYFNFEFNAGGTLSVSYVTDPTRPPGGKLKQASPLPLSLGRQVGVAHSLPEVVEPEIATPTVWTLAFCIPLSLFEPYLGVMVPKAGEQWRANFFKCGDATSHPHWAAWSEVDQLNFHLPRLFGTLVFG